MADRIGQQVGNYRLLRLLGRGGFAEVYLGQHLRLSSQQAAIKILSTRLDEADIRAFEQEAETIASLIHPHIVRVLDFDVANGIPFLVMDYAPNGSLRQRHQSGEQVPLSTVVSYVQQVADGLQYAHDQKRIHRDVKPDNMLIGRRGEILLSDFGLATIAHSTASQGTQAASGTIPYMAPEQMQKHPQLASDQYALAITVYEWLVGERPFSGSFVEIAAKHAMMPPPPLRAKRPALSSAIEYVVLIALAKDSKARFDSVQAFATALKEASAAAPSAYATADLSARSAWPPPLPTIPAQSASRDVGVAASEMASSVLQVTRPEQMPLPPITLPPGEVAKPDVKIFGAEQASTKGEPAKRRIARRAVITTGLAATGVVVVGGVLVWNAPQHRSSSSPTPSATAKTGATTTPAKTGATTTPATTGAPTTQIGTLLYRYHGHFDTVNAVVWSPDGKRIASGSSDNTVQVWDATTGGHVYTYRRHLRFVNAVAWSPDGKLIASGSYDNTVQVWDATTGGHIYTYSSHAASINAVPWSPDGQFIASGDDDNIVQVWVATTGGRVYTYGGHTYYVNAVAWSPNGKRIASGSYDRTVKVWDATTGGHIYTYIDHADSVNAVAWSPDGKRIASGSSDNTVQVWDATTGDHVYTYRRHSSFVKAVAWSPDGKRIASGGDDNTVQVWVAGS